MTGSVIAAVEHFLSDEGRKIEHRMHCSAVPKYNVDAFDVIFTRPWGTMAPIERAAYSLAAFLMFKRLMTPSRFGEAVRTFAVCPLSDLSPRWHGRPDRDAFHSFAEGVLSHAVDNETIPALLYSISCESNEVLRKLSMADERAFVVRHLGALDY